MHSFGSEEGELLATVTTDTFDIECPESEGLVIERIVWGVCGPVW